MVDFIATIIASLICLSMVLVPLGLVAFLVVFIYKKVNKKSKQSKTIKYSPPVKKKIYMLQHYPETLNLFMDVLANADYLIKGNTDPIKALHELSQDKFDLIISDIVMINLDGFKVLERLKSDNLTYKFDKFIFFSGLGGDIIMEKALEAGADGYLISSEDTSLEDFIAYVKKILGDTNNKDLISDSYIDQNVADDIVYVSQNPPAIKYNEPSFLKIVNSSNLSTEQKKWITILEIPYKRQLLNIAQCEFETMRLYADLAIFTDNYLKQKRTSLKEIKKRLDGSNQHYTNILYTLECIAEGEVQRYYRGSNNSNNDFSFELLTKHIDQHISKKIRLYLFSRTTQIISPNQDTIEKLGLLENGMHHIWWDIDGTLRETLNLSQADIYWLDEMHHRQTKFLDIKQCRIEVTKLYLKLISILNSNQNNNQLNQVALRFLSQLFKRSEGYQDARSFFLKDIYKLSENAIREIYPLNRLLNCKYEEARIKKTVGNEGLELIKKEIHLLKKEVAKPNKDTLTILYKSNPNSWKSRITLLKKSLTKDNAIDKFKEGNDLLADFINTDTVPKIAYKLTLTFSKFNKIIALFYYYKHTVNNPESKKLPSKVYKKLFLKKQQYFKFVEISKRQLTDKKVLEELKGIYKRTRKKISIDSNSVNLISNNHTETVKKLVKYIGEDKDNKAIIDIDSNDSSLSDIFSSEKPIAHINLDSLQQTFLQLILKRHNQISQSELQSFAITNDQLPHSLVEKVNQSFYDVYEDSLLLKEENYYKLDTEYISLIKNIVNGH